MSSNHRNKYLSKKAANMIIIAKLNHFASFRYGLAGLLYFSFLHTFSATLFQRVPFNGDVNSKLLLDITVPSQIACIHKCMHVKGVAVYANKRCRCIQTQNDDDVGEKTMVSGMMYTPINKQCKCNEQGSSCYRINKYDGHVECAYDADAKKDIVELKLTNPKQSSLYISTDYTADLAIDGDPFFSSCANTKGEENAEWWSAELTNEAVIDTIELYLRDECEECIYLRYQHVLAYTKKTNESGWVLCKDFGSLQYKGIKYLRCDKKRAAKHIKLVLQQKHQFGLCEVKIFGYIP